MDEAVTKARWQPTNSAEKPYFGVLGRRQLEKVAYGAGKPGLNLENIKNILVPISPIDECKIIAELLEKKTLLLTKLIMN